MNRQTNPLPPLLEGQKAFGTTFQVLSKSTPTVNVSLCAAAAAAAANALCVLKAGFPPAPGSCEYASNPAVPKLPEPYPQEALNSWQNLSFSE